MRPYFVCRIRVRQIELRLDAEEADCTRMTFYKLIISESGKPTWALSACKPLSSLHNYTPPVADVPHER